MPQLKQNADASMGIQGSDGDDGSFIKASILWNANVNTSGAFLTVSTHVFARRMIVKSITYVNDTAATNAVTATVFRAPSATALGSGTALHSGTANLQATAGANNTLTLAINSTLDIAAGTRIGLVISGAPGAAGVGCITVTLAPA